MYEFGSLNFFLLHVFKSCIDPFDLYLSMAADIPLLSVERNTLAVIQPDLILFFESSSIYVIKLYESVNSNVWERGLGGRRSKQMALILNGKVFRDSRVHLR